MTTKIIEDMELTLSMLESLCDFSMLKMLSPLLLILFVVFIFVGIVIFVKIYNGDGDEILPFCLLNGVLLLVLLLSFNFCYSIDSENFELYSNKVIEQQEKLDTYKASAVKRETILSNIDEILVNADESQINRAILVLEINHLQVGDNLTQNIVILKEVLYKTTIEKCEMVLNILES